MYIRTSKSTDFEVFTPAHHDILEAEAYGITPSFPPASECVTMDLNGFPLAIGGNNGDQVWMVTSNQVWRLGRADKLRFYKEVCKYRDRMLDSYSVLWNFVYVGNIPHIRFLESIGAVFQDEYTGDGMFRLFTIRRDHEGM